jgi:hypothetical protein
LVHLTQDSKGNSLYIYIYMYEYIYTRFKDILDSSTLAGHDCKILIPSYFIEYVDQSTHKITKDVTRVLLYECTVCVVRQK